MPAQLKNNLHLFSQKPCQQLREESGAGTADPLPPMGQQPGPAWQAPSTFLRSWSRSTSAKTWSVWSGARFYSVSEWPV